FARIDFLRQGGRLVDKKGTYNVKFTTEKLTKAGKLTSVQFSFAPPIAIRAYHRQQQFTPCITAYM
ncbi:MAG: hypothetical protein D8H98_10985, partial [Prevotella sp.]